MNVYDFDKTIYDGDSTVDFVLYCLKRQPSLIRFFPGTGIGFLRYALKQWHKTQAKEYLYRMFQGIDDIDALLSDFWEINKRKIKPWYAEKLQREDDVVITASPEFTVAPICETLGIKTCMGSIVDKKTGKYSGPNCDNAEKVRRFYERFPDGVIEEFYSDSLIDTPLARVAETAFLVKGDDLLPWPEETLK